MKIINKFLALLALFALIAVPAYANNGSKGHGHGKVDSAPVRLRIPLKASDPALTDLASAFGRLDFQSKKGKRQFKVRVQAPFPAASLGCTDIAAAQAAAIHIEISRAAVVINDCTLAFAQSDHPKDPELRTKVNYRAHGRVGGSQHASRMIKGSCSAGVPSLNLGDTVIVYAIVNGLRVDFLAP